MRVFLATAATILMSVNTFAAIGAGSAVDFKSVYSDGTSTVNESLNYTILSEDKTKGTVKVQITVDDGTTKKVTEEETETVNATFGAALVQGCVANKGTLEKIKVAAGEFETCHLTDVDVAQDYVGDFWIGDVAFGTIKSVETLGKESLTVELQAAK